MSFGAHNSCKVKQTAMLSVMPLTTYARCNDNIEPFKRNESQGVVSHTCDLRTQENEAGGS